MKIKTMGAALAAGFVMSASAQAAVVTYEISQNFSTYQNNLDGSPASWAGGGLLSGTLVFDADTGAFVSAEFTSGLPGPGDRTSVYDTEADATADGVSTTSSFSGNVLSLGTYYNYTTWYSNYIPQNAAALTLDFGSSTIGDAVITATASEIFYNYFWAFNVNGLYHTTGVHGSQGGALSFSLVDTEGGTGEPVLETPLPAAFPLMFAGLAGFAAASRGRRKAA